MEGMPFLFIRGFVLFLYYLIHYSLSVLKQHLADVDSFLRSRKEGAVEAVIRYFYQLSLGLEPVICKMPVGFFHAG